MRVALLLLTLLTLIFIRSILWKVSLRTATSDALDSPENSPLVVVAKKTTRTQPVLQLFTIPTDEWHQPPGLAPWQETDKPLCTREQIRNGTWVPTMLEEAPYVTQTTHLRCYPKEHFQQKPFPSYKWEPTDSSCDFSKFRYEMMCRLLVDATVMIVGDSLVSIDRPSFGGRKLEGSISHTLFKFQSWEHYSSLVQLLGHPIHQGFQHQSLEFRKNIVQNLKCGKEDRNARLVYRRDDKLEELKNALVQDFPTVLVLNRGAHYTNDTVLLGNVYKNIEILNKYWWKPCEQHGLQCHFFWRTSVPGHPHCEQFTEPVNDRAAMEAWIANRSNYNEHTIQYHWYDYQRQNLLVEKVWLEKANFPVTILDAYDLNVLRPDEHRAHQGDCLHNCYPGKMDVYNQLMLHYVRKDRTMEAVQNQRLVAPHLARSNDKATVYDREGWMKARQEREERKRDRHTHTYAH
eukprot:scaffold4860_cov171-Amphora_coffeaeformis.AAC.7